MLNESDLNLAINTQDVKSLRDIALDSLREAIIGGVLKPGSHLKERELAKMMGISTTPIKEALRMLSHEGLVETLPRKGTYVSPVVDSSIEEMLLLKANLEGLMAKLAATKITDEEIAELSKQVERMEELSKQQDTNRLAEENSRFHTLINTFAKNTFIFQMLMNVNAFDRAFRKRALKYGNEVEEGLSEHKKVFEAIKNRNPELAEIQMKNHIIRTAENVLKKWKVE
ncbi:GntR family transcriptional regulator [Brevibacillus sp. B_LB10_24]|uniref:GntR family transcriptional regulator n=1 Tax=Brevibacillus sp. B_LB10_24 TaxID=3380645 RepID=UPI0038B9265E